MKDITLRQLRIIATISRVGKINRAANDLSVTPPAVTEQLRLVEESLGLRLFDRTKTGLRPTDAGLLMTDTAARVEAVLADTAERLSAIKGLGGGHVTIGVVSTAKYFAPRLIAAFIERHPQIELKLVVGNRSETITALRNYDIDIAVMGRPPDDIPVGRASFASHPHVVIAPPGHPLASRRRPIDRHALAGEKLLVREEGSGTRKLFEQFFTGIEVAMPPVQIEIGSNETIKQAVMAGLGLAFISAHTIELEVRTGRLVILNVKDLPIMREWFLVHRTDKRLGPAASAFWDYVLAEGGAFIPDVLAGT